MGWVKDAVRQLKEKGTCQVRPMGGSMRGRIESGQLVTINLVDSEDIKEDDVVFVRWKGNYLLHLVMEVTREKIVIGNNLGKINGEVSKNDIMGKVIKIEDSIEK